MKFTENHSRPVKRRSDDSKIDKRVALFSLKQLLSAKYFFCFFYFACDGRIYKNKTEKL